MRVLVTGGGGFLGKHIIDLCLERGYWVRSFSRSPQKDLEAKGVQVRCGDLADVVAVNNVIFDVDAVFHVAAKAAMWGSWDSFYQTNVQGTKNVILACQTQGNQHLVYTSTPSVVFNGQDLNNVDETQPYGHNWLCHYAHTKRIAEELVLKAGGIALRPHLIYGNGDPHLTPKILELAKQKKLKIVGNGQNIVDLTHVKNAAKAHLLALDSLIEGRCQGQAYFITDGTPVNLWSWINNLLQSHNIDPINQKVSLKKAYLAGNILEFIYKLLRIETQPPMTRFIATELAKNHYFNIEKAKQDLAYTPILNA